MEDFQKKWGLPLWQVLRWKHSLKHPEAHKNRELRVKSRADVATMAKRRLEYLEKQRKDDYLAEEDIFETEDEVSGEEQEDLENMREELAMRQYRQSGLAEAEVDEVDSEGELINPELSDPHYYKTRVRPRWDWTKGFSKRVGEEEMGIPPEEWAEVMGGLKGMDPARAQALLNPQSSSTTPVDPLADRARRAAEMGLQEYVPPPILPVKRTKGEAAAARDKRKKRKKMTLVAVKPDEEEDDWIA